MPTLNKLHLAVLLPVAAGVIHEGQALADEGEMDPAAEVSATSQASDGAAERIRVGGFLGGNFLSGENELGNSFHDDQVPGSGLLFGLRGNYLLSDTIAPGSALNPQLRVEVEAKFATSSTDGNSDRESISTPIVGWRAHALVDLMPDKKVVPFALIGVGGETVFGENKFMTSPDTDFAAYIGGGARYPLAGQIDLRGDVRLGMTAAREGALAGLAELHLGVAYTFGTRIPEILASSEPEPGQEPTPKNIADADGDGVADEDDACPSLAEVFNGIDDTDGCPEVDSDGDGLVGSQDNCPAAAEDKDGFEDQDGCPEPDNDQDGRPDVIDSCPLKAENLNGFEDEDGCPDEIPEQLAQFTGAIKGIEFRTASARILRKSRNTLDGAFKVLSENSSVRIEISGHTDNQGSAKGNRSLSRKRADYVKWYLVDKGIHADRLWTQGHGPDKPVATNETREGRQKNRRIEFRLLPGAATVAAPAPKTPTPKAAPAPKTAPVSTPAKPVPAVKSEAKKKGPAAGSKAAKKAARVAKRAERVAKKKAERAAKKAAKTAKQAELASKKAAKAEKAAATPADAKAADAKAADKPAKPSEDATSKKNP